MIDWPGGHTPGFIGKIPVRNVWLLLLYASKLYSELPHWHRVEFEDAPDEIPQMVAEILANAIERRLRRNLSYGYQKRRAELGRVRGRIDFSRTEKRLLKRRGRIACEFDELTVNTLRNRFVRVALEKTAAALEGANGQQDLAHRCRRLTLRLARAGVEGSIDSRSATAAAHDRAGWLDVHERRMLSAARLAWDLAIPTEQPGTGPVPTPNLERVQGWRLYELAVHGFYQAALGHQGWNVHHHRQFRWPESDPPSSLDAILPGMLPDILLERVPGDYSGPSRRIVIDTKFSSILQSGQAGKGSLKSANIYQIYAYLRSQERDDDPVTRDSHGVLLHPSLGVDYYESGIIQGHRLTFATVDLAADSATIREQLLQVVA